MGSHDTTKFSRYTIRLPVASGLRFEKTAADLGIMRGNLISVCAVLGLTTIERALRADSGLGPDVWKMIGQGMGETAQEAIKGLMEGKP